MGLINRYLINKAINGKTEKQTDFYLSLQDSLYFLWDLKLKLRSLLRSLFLLNYKIFRIELKFFVAKIKRLVL